MRKLVRAIPKEGRPVLKLLDKATHLAIPGAVLIAEDHRGC
jgi:hypothetical protein